MIKTSNALNYNNSYLGEHSLCLCETQNVVSTSATSYSRHSWAIYWLLWIGLAFSISPVHAADKETPFQLDWLAVSDPIELERTWTSALVYLPEKYNWKRGKLLEDEEALNSFILSKMNGTKLPLILFLHACEGLQHHWEDLEKYSQLGFSVIALDSIAREHRPMACNESRELYIKYYDIAVAFRKAELDYAVNRLKKLTWIDLKNLFLIGSGTGGMVTAHYEGTEFVGRVIEGWGCHHPQKVFDGIWAPKEVRVFSVVSKSDSWYLKNSGFSGDCAEFLQDRPDSVAVTLDLDMSAHYVAWQPESRPSLIKFLTRDLDVDQDALLDDTPIVIEINDQAGIKLKKRWSLEAVFNAAKIHCSRQGKASHVIDNTPPDVYTFICS